MPARRGRGGRRRGSSEEGPPPPPSPLEGEGAGAEGEEASAKAAIVEVRARPDLYVVRRAVQQVAREAGVKGAPLDGLLLAAAELASNLVRYAEGGRVTVGVVERAGRRGVEVRGDDEGPGIADLEQALRDGVSTAAHSLGSGFGAMRRGTDGFSIESSPAGTHVVLTTWARAG